MWVWLTAAFLAAISINKAQGFETLTDHPDEDVEVVLSRRKGTPVTPGSCIASARVCMLYSAAVTVHACAL